MPTNNSILAVVVGMGLFCTLAHYNYTQQQAIARSTQCPTIGQLRSRKLGLIDQSASKNIFFDTFDAITHEDRSRALQQNGATLWMTGLSGSGKSTIGKALEKRLVFEDNLHMYRLDGDNLRFGLSKDLELTSEDRTEAVRRAYEVSLMMADSGVLSLVSLISPYRKDRDAARSLHTRMNIPFIEVFVKADVSVARERDPKGLYRRAFEGKLKGMTGIDAPYEVPLNPEIVLDTATCCEVVSVEQRLADCRSSAKTAGVKFQEHCPRVVEQCIDSCVSQLRQRLIDMKILIDKSNPTAAIGEAQGQVARLHADGYKDGVAPADIIESDESFWISDEVTSLQPVPIRDVDVQWVQVIGEGWAAPLKGPMRESTLVQVLHYESILFDKDAPHNVSKVTDFDDYNSAERLAHQGVRVNMPVPITIPVSSHTKMLIARACKQQAPAACKVLLVSPAGEPVAILENPEVYPFRKEEMITRSWGSWDLHHPYIQENIVNAPDYLVGGELDKIRRIRFRDGLDKWRHTPAELIEKFREKGSDAVFAFQTRNPTHAGHAHLMKQGRKDLIAKGYKNPVLWLSPLGGWTKDDDVPLDIRVKQHQAVLDEKMLDNDWTVLSIWPSPMVYSGPTEVQWHAKSRRVAGADYFIVGRDPAGLAYSDQYAKAHNQSKGDDVYHADHGRYVLQTSPGLGKLGLLASGAVHYDKTDGEMKPKPDGMTKDEFNQRFLKISGSKMRQMGRMMVDVCPDLASIPSNWGDNPSCVPPKFMVPSGWAIMRDYYKRKDEPEVKANAILQSKMRPLTHKDTESVNAVKVGLSDNTFAVYLTDSTGNRISPWHDVPLRSGSYFNMVVEIPKGTNSKFEVQKDLPMNPIKQDMKNGQPRFYTYGMAFFNNGLFPQTWEDSGLETDGYLGDNDPLDVMEIGRESFPIGSVVQVKVLGALALIDEGETDWKIIAIATSDPDASRVNSIQDLAQVRGEDFIARIREWLRRYKTTDKKNPDTASINQFLEGGNYRSAADAEKIVLDTHRSWASLQTALATDRTRDFWLKPH